MSWSLTLVAGFVVGVIVISLSSLFLFGTTNPIFDRLSSLFSSYDQDIRNAILCAIERAKSGCNDPLIDTIRWKSYDENGSLVEVSCIEFCNREQFFDKNGRVFGFESIYYPVEISVSGEDNIIGRYSSPEIKCLTLASKIVHKMYPNKFSLDVGDNYIIIDDSVIKKYPTPSDDDCDGAESYDLLDIKNSKLYIYTVTDPFHDKIVYVNSTNTYPIIEPNGETYVNLTLTETYYGFDTSLDISVNFYGKAIRLRVKDNNYEKDLIVVADKIDGENKNVVLSIYDFTDNSLICQKTINKGSRDKCELDDIRELDFFVEDMFSFSYCVIHECYGSRCGSVYKYVSQENDDICDVVLSTINSTKIKIRFQTTDCESQGDGYVCLSNCGPCNEVTRYSCSNGKLCCYCPYLTEIS